jgi:hypothetical protein
MCVLLLVRVTGIGRPCIVTTGGFPASTPSEVNHP